MRGLLARIGVGMALPLLALGPPAPGRAESVPLHQVPRPVLDAVGERFRGGRIAGAERDRAGAGFLYEVTIRQGGQKVDVTVTPAGEIRLIKREIAVADLPEPVTRALRAAYPRATWDVAEAVTAVQGPRETLVHYEIDLVTAERRIVEVRVGVDGTILGPRP